VTAAAVRRTLGPVLVLSMTVAGLVVMADATQFRGDSGRTGSTRVVFGIETRNYHHHADDAATALWVPCIGAVGWRSVGMPVRLDCDQHREKIDIDPSYTGVTYVAEVRPSLGEHTRRRLWGCLEDGTVDKVRGTVFEARVMR